MYSVNRRVIAQVSFDYDAIDPLIAEVCRCCESECECELFCNSKRSVNNNINPLDVTGANGYKSENSFFKNIP